MDCKLENAARSLLRIEVIILQGLLHTLLLFLGGVVFMPFLPFVYMVVAWRMRKGSGIWFKTVVAPLWLLSGIVFALVLPFSLVCSSLSDLKGVATIEWANRWRAGCPKKPNGHPIPEPLLVEDGIRQMAAFASSVRDYNAEAAKHGQGLPLG